MLKWRQLVYALMAAIGLAVLLGTRSFYYYSGHHLAECSPVVGSIWSDMLMFALFWLTAALYYWKIVDNARWDRILRTMLLALLGAAFLRGVFGIFFGPGDENAFLEGVRDRLNVAVDPKELQDWACEAMPGTTPKTGFQIHLPNGQSVSPELSASAGLSGGEGISFLLSSDCVPTKWQTLFKRPPVVKIFYYPDPAMRHVVVGNYNEQFGWFIASGSTKYGIDEGMNYLRWKDGLYICVRAGR